MPYSALDLLRCSSSAERLILSPPLIPSFKSTTDLNLQVSLDVQINPFNYSVVRISSALVPWIATPNILDLAAEQVFMKHYNCHNPINTALPGCSGDGRRILEGRNLNLGRGFDTDAMVVIMCLLVLGIT
ncbi:hypothetical protein U9M48_044023 [Paspalum notatum var. saurae]|uniref:Uncharacterized protein n=1 Tax=Paspalum notatum var. saurae TaxID=547442 RepID=A0AAQ3XH25_PASNO